MLFHAKQRHLLVGKFGEWIAALYLIGKGFSIRGRNIRLGRGETDLIAFRHGHWHIVEVRTRRTKKKTPDLEDLLPFRKRRHLAVNRHYILQTKPLLDVDEDRVHIDLLGIALRPWRFPSITHIEDVDALDSDLGIARY